MNLDIAEKVYARKGVPETVEGQRALLREAGYQNLGRTPLSQCSNRQVYAVAARVYETARKTMEEYRRNAEMRACQASWSERLYDMFNIPRSEWGDVDPSDLEAELLK